VQSIEFVIRVGAGTVNACLILLRNQVGMSNDLASLLYSRTSAEIITSRTLLSGDNNFTDAGRLVRCHDNEVTL
jgi:hypothetical protein